jgi:hypothetical protein
MPPPIGRYPDRDTLVESIRDFALSQGYGITLKNANEDRKAYIRCFRSGKPNMDSRPLIGLESRTRGSFKTDCPFQVYISRNKDCGYRASIGRNPKIEGLSDANNIDLI